jgi:hypothetical protein
LRSPAMCLQKLCTGAKATPELAGGAPWPPMDEALRLWDEALRLWEALSPW